MNNRLITILLIEDDEDDYVITRDLLAEIEVQQFQLDWASSYEEGWHLLQQQRHDVYLVDYILGSRNGLDLLHDAVQAGCKPPIILLTGQSDPSVDLAAMKAGAADYLVKGKMDASLLERSIRYAIERYRVLEELRHTLEENTQLASAIANVTTGVVITDPSHPDNPIVFVNPAFESITGYSAEEVLGKNCRFLRGAETDIQTVQMIRDALIAHESINCTLINYRKDGTPFWNELLINPVFDAHGNVVRFIGLQNDVTNRKLSEAALRDSEERYALAVHGANDGIWDWNLRTQQVYFSPRWKTMLGYRDDEISNGIEEWYERIHPEDQKWFQTHIDAHLNGLTPYFEHEHRMRHRDGTYRWMLTRGIAVRDDGHNATRMAGSQTDITDRKQAEQQLLHDALHDALTGLPNRTLLMDRLRHALQIAQRNDLFRFAVIFLDIDRFKMVNDGLGHLVGDRLIVGVAKRLELFGRPGDTLARLGGDEFVLLLEDINNIDDVTAIADQIQREIQKPFEINGYEIFITVSMGITFSVSDYEWSEDLLRDADTAMYQAKAQGRSRYEIFNHNMHTRAVAQLRLETDLRRALERQEFFLLYQPIVCLRTCQIIGFEALVRWRHPERGLVPPVDFIPIAEETGLITTLGYWVLREACQQMREWQQQFHDLLPMTICVNLSGRQFTANLVDQVQHILDETQLQPAHLKLEITESVLMDNTEAATTILAQLKAMGVQLSMDDFGTGYSSLNYLHRFPIDTLKIDRSFINKIDSDAEQLAIVRTIVTLAWNLGMDVIAEGIESAKHLAQLKALQCEYGQGYYFSAPLDPRAAVDFILNQAQLSELMSCPIPQIGSA